MRGVDLLSFFHIIRWDTFPNNIKEGSRPVVILPHHQVGHLSKQHQGGESTCCHSSTSPGGTPFQTTSRRGVDLLSFFHITRWDTFPNNIKEGSRPVVILPHHQVGHLSKQHQGGESTPLLDVVWKGVPPGD